MLLFKFLVGEKVTESLFQAMEQSGAPGLGMDVMAFGLVFWQRRYCATGAFQESHGDSGGTVGFVFPIYHVHI